MNEPKNYERPEVALEDDGPEVPREAPVEGTYLASTEAAPLPSVLGEHWAWASDLDWPDEKPARRKCLLHRPAEADGEESEQDFLPLGKVGMLVAAGGAGKTMALVQLAVSIIRGTPWLGYYPVPVAARGPVVLALAEEDAEETRRRLWAVREHMGAKTEEWREVLRQLVVLPLASVDVALVTTDRHTRDTTRTAVLTELRERLDGFGVDWRLVVLDPLSRWAGAETEIDNNAATRFVAALETLTQARGNPTVIVAHHSNKSARMGTGPNDATAARGASGLTDGVRWVATLGPHPTLDKMPALSLVKSNYGPPAETRALERGEGGVLTIISPDEEKERLMRQGPNSAKRKGDRKAPVSETMPRSAPRSASDEDEDWVNRA